MACPASGAIKIGDLKTEWGSTANNLGAYYKNGAIVGGNDTGVANVPTSGAIKLSNFYSATHVTISITIPTSAFGSCGSTTTSCHANTNSISVTVTGGTATAYSWRKVSGSGGHTADTPTASSTIFSLTASNGGAPGGLDYVSYWVCDVTVNGTVYTSNQCTVTTNHWYDGIPP